jgi:hypothetical protein
MQFSSFPLGRSIPFLRCGPSNASHPLPPGAGETVCQRTRLAAIRTPLPQSAASCWPIRCASPNRPRSRPLPRATPSPNPRHTPERASHCSSPLPPQPLSSRLSDNLAALRARRTSTAAPVPAMTMKRLNVKERASHVPPAGQHAHVLEPTAYATRERAHCRIRHLRLRTWPAGGCVYPAYF